MNFTDTFDWFEFSLPMSKIARDLGNLSEDQVMMEEDNFLVWLETHLNQVKFLEPYSEV